MFILYIKIFVMKSDNIPNILSTNISKLSILSFFIIFYDILLNCSEILNKCNLTVQAIVGLLFVFILIRLFNFYQNKEYAKLAGNLIVLGYYINSVYLGIYAFKYIKYSNKLIDNIPTRNIILILWYSNKIMPYAGKFRNTGYISVYIINLFFGSEHSDIKFYKTVYSIIIVLAYTQLMIFKTELLDTAFNIAWYLTKDNITTVIYNTPGYFYNFLTSSLTDIKTVVLNPKESLYSAPSYIYEWWNQPSYSQLLDQKLQSYFEIIDNTSNEIKQIANSKWFFLISFPVDILYLLWPTIAGFLIYQRFEYNTLYLILPIIFLQYVTVTRNTHIVDKGITKNIIGTAQSCVFYVDQYLNFINEKKQILVRTVTTVEDIAKSKLSQIALNYAVGGLGTVAGTIFTYFKG